MLSPKFPRINPKHLLNKAVGDIMKTWGIFGIAHFISWFVAAAIIFSLYFLIRNRSNIIQRIVLSILSFSGIAAIIFNLVNWGTPLEYLPFHLCSINAILLPIALFTKNKTIGNMLVLWCLGALAAILMNFYADCKNDLFSARFLFFYLPHVLEFGIPIIAFKLGIIKLDYKTILKTLVLTACIYTAVHFINLGLIEYTTAKNITDTYGNPLHINYMYSLQTEGFPLLSTLWKIIPYSYWYMYLVFPIILIYLTIIYLPQIIKEKRSKA